MKPMKLYHWKAANVEMLVMAKSEEDARKACEANASVAMPVLGEQRWKELMSALALKPYFVAEAGHVIALW